MTTFWFAIVVGYVLGAVVGWLVRGKHEEGNVRRAQEAAQDRREDERHARAVLREVRRVALADDSPVALANPAMIVAVDRALGSTTPERTWGDVLPATTKVILDDADRYLKLQQIDVKKN